MIEIQSYPCSHAVCRNCAKMWLWLQDQEQGDAPGETCFQCPICRAVTGVDAAGGFEVLALKNIVDILT